MIQVNCPSCPASYEVDERRLPADGLKMRCPKCGNSFQVLPDGSTRNAVSASAPPKPRPKRKKTQVGLGPNVKAPGPPPLPAAPRGGPTSSTAKSLADEETDLPAPVAAPPFADLPAPKAGGASLDLDPFGELPTAVDLPAPKARDDARPSGFDPFADMDLPAPLEDPGATDLPAPLGHAQGGWDLPRPKHASGSSPPGRRRSFDDEIDLPMALTDAELPAPMSLDSELPMRFEQDDLPVPRDDFSDPPIDGPARVHGGGPIELDLPDGEDLSLDMDIDPGVRRPAPVPPLPSVGGLPSGVSSPGSPRISRDSGELDLPESDDLEFSELPSHGEVEGEVHRMPHPGGERAPQQAGAKRKRSIDIRGALAVKRPPWLMKLVGALAAFAMVLGAGFYMGGTKYGLFGVHLVEPLLPGSGDVIEVTQVIQGAETTAGRDTYAATKQALAQLDEALDEAPLNQALVARALLHESFFQLRYGQEGKAAKQADSHRMHLKRRGDEAPGVHVALAANALRQGDASAAKAELALAKAEDQNDPYVDLVRGEVALVGADSEKAREAFGSALKKDGSARAQWGLARAHQLAGQVDDALAAAEATLRLSPMHAGARIAVAESLIAKGDTEGANELLQVPAGLAPAEDGSTLEVAPADRSAALALVARIEEQRGRIGVAREMYERAVELDAGNAWAAVGAARLVLLEGGFADALARFQTVIGAAVPPGAELHPTGQPKVLVEAKLGAVEALIALDKPGQARKLIADLETEEPVSAEVEIWQGKVAEALGDSAPAVRHFRNAIELEPKGFRGYMALARHYKATKRPGEAVAVLVEAQQNVEITAEVRRFLGDAELERNRIDEAIREYQAALEIEPRDASAQFGLAVAYRRKLALDDAAAALAIVEELDASYPGLALEKGRLAEAKGDLESAVTRYRAALEATPEDSALQSRLGAALVLTGELDEAEQVLQKVLAAQPYSAEAEHFLGRIALERGDLISARQHFLQATRLNPQQGLYRLYVAWAALEANEWTTALRELDAALKLDPTLGDAYWLRARIRIRAGQVRDALADLQKAIELNPGRTEAWAEIGEAQYQLGKMSEAIAAYQTALETHPDAGEWWYRLGRLQVDQGQRAGALESLGKAVAIGDALPEAPSWLADSHRLIGDVYFAQRERKEAIVHYGRYLELARPDAIDRPDVLAKLREIGSASR